MLFCHLSNLFWWGVYSDLLPIFIQVICSFKLSFKGVLPFIRYVTWNYVPHSEAPCPDAVFPRAPIALWLLGAGACTSVFPGRCWKQSTPLWVFLESWLDCVTWILALTPFFSLAPVVLDTGCYPWFLSSVFCFLGLSVPLLIVVADPGCAPWCSALPLPGRWPSAHPWLGLTVFWFRFCWWQSCLTWCLVSRKVIVSSVVNYKATFKLGICCLPPT